MNVLVAGGTGFIGSRLLKSLRGDGHAVTLLTRSAVKAEKFKADGVAALVWSGPEWAKALETTDAVINLAGEGVADGRWSAARKRRILDSRVESTRSLVAAIEKTGNRPKVLINASAVGFYGPRDREGIDESVPAGKGFLPDVCVAWEREALKAQSSGLRVVLLRIGVVLGRDGGALPRMLLPFRLGLGGRLGSGDQWFPWVHVDDVVGLAKEALTNAALSGPVNVAAPESATNAQFTAELGSLLHRPTIAPVPAFALKLLLGEMSEMMLTGQRVVPRAAEKAGYRFKFPRLQECLSAALER
jgi:uncharacterized protein (TIGR01777 family)